MVTLGSLDVDPKSQGRPVCPKAQAAVKYLVSQVKTVDTHEHDDSIVSTTDDNNFGSTNGDDNDNSCVDDNCDNYGEDEEIVTDKGCVGDREVNRNAVRGNSAGIIAPAGWKDVTKVPEKKVIKHNDELSSDSDLDDGEHSLSCCNFGNLSLTHLADTFQFTVKIIDVVKGKHVQDIFPSTILWPAMQDWLSRVLNVHPAMLHAQF